MFVEQRSRGKFVQDNKNDWGWIGNVYALNCSGNVHRKHNPKDWRGKQEQGRKNQHSRRQQAEEQPDGRKEGIEQGYIRSKHQCSVHQKNALYGIEQVEGGQDGECHSERKNRIMDPVSQPLTHQTAESLHTDKAERQEYAENRNQSDDVYSGKVLKDKELGLAR